MNRVLGVVVATVVALGMFFNTTGTREINGLREEYKLYQWMIIFMADSIKEGK